VSILHILFPKRRKNGKKEEKSLVSAPGEKQDCSANERKKLIYQVKQAAEHLSWSCLFQSRRANFTFVCFWY